MNEILSKAGVPKIVDFRPPRKGLKEDAEKLGNNISLVKLDIHILQGNIQKKNLRIAGMLKQIEEIAKAISGFIE